MYDKMAPGRGYHAEGDMLTFESGDGYQEMEILPLRNGFLSIEVTNPWKGDSERGFGESGDVWLTADEARFLAAWLTKYADSITAAEPR